MPETGRTARYVCAAALAGGEEAVFLGECQGVVLEEPRGSGGFGYDPLFYIPSEGCTFGELPPARKNEISHRGRAVRRVADSLRARLQG
ncbi:MAG: non-canonical purine NTP pyrophosphatase, partial [Gemmatimonadetes bacterium]|nr:non-canonical purine NTP pyrophosphatase [Gemmatimonadota bacterium]